MRGDPSRADLRPGRSSEREKIIDHDVRVLIFGTGREVAIARRIPVLVKASTNRDDLPRTDLLAPLLDQVNCVSRLMRDALTIVVVHISR